MSEESKQELEERIEDLEEALGDIRSRIDEILGSDGSEEEDAE